MASLPVRFQVLQFWGIGVPQWEERLQGTTLDEGCRLGFLQKTTSSVRGPGEEAHNRTVGRSAGPEEDWSDWKHRAGRSERWGPEVRMGGVDGDVRYGFRGDRG